MKLLRVCVAMGVGCVVSGAGAAPMQAATLRIAGKTVTLNRVLALRHGDEEGMAEGPHLRIFLTDRDLPLDIAGRATILRAKGFAQAAGISGVMIRTDPAGKGKSAEVSVLAAPGLKPEMFALATSTAAFNELKVSGNQVTGAISIKTDDLALEGRFDAPIATNPVTADLKGKAALDSPAAQAIVNYVASLRKADLAAAGKYATPAKLKEIQDFRAQAGEAAFKEALRAGPDGPTLAKNIKRVVVRGASATVITSDGTSFDVIQDGGNWKAD